MPVLSPLNKRKIAVEQVAAHTGRSEGAFQPAEPHRLGNSTLSTVLWVVYERDLVPLPEDGGAVNVWLVELSVAGRLKSFLKSKTDPDGDPSPAIDDWKSGERDESSWAPVVGKISSIRRGPIPDKEKAVEYLKSGVVAPATTFLQDRNSGEPDRVPVSVHTDGVHVWNGEVTYYYEHHGELPPPGLLRQMQRRNFIFPKLSQEQLQEAYENYRSDDSCVTSADDALQKVADLEVSSPGYYQVAEWVHDLCQLPTSVTPVESRYKKAGGTDVWVTFSEGDRVYRGFVKDGSDSAKAKKLSKLLSAYHKGAETIAPKAVDRVAREAASEHGVPRSRFRVWATESPHHVWLVKAVGSAAKKVGDLAYVVTHKGEFIRVQASRATEETIGRLMSGSFTRNKNILNEVAALTGEAEENFFFGDCYPSMVNHWPDDVVPVRRSSSEAGDNQLWLVDARNTGAPQILADRHLPPGMDVREPLEIFLQEALPGWSPNTPKPIQNALEAKKRVSAEYALDPAKLKASQEQKSFWYVVQVDENNQPLRTGSSYLVEPETGRIHAVPASASPYEAVVDLLSS